MARFRKLPVIIDAVRVKHRVSRLTNQGNLRARPGDWLITGVSGEMSACSDDIFRATHEPVNDEAREMMEG